MFTKKILQVASYGRFQVALDIYFLTGKFLNHTWIDCYDCYHIQVVGDDAALIMISPMPFTVHTGMKLHII